MMRKITLRCENQVVHIESDSEGIQRFIDWIVECDHYTERYNEEDVDIFVFDNITYFYSCRKKAIMLNLLQIAKIS